MAEHIPPEFLASIAVSELRAWLMQHNFNPSRDWDSSDPSCLRDYGCHVVFTLSGRTDIPADQIDIEQLYTDFTEYFHARNKLPGAVNLEPYGLELYECPCGCGTYLYASIYQ